MQINFSRRNFLKLLSLLPLARLMPPSSKLFTESSQIKNIFIIVFDTWSANHLPFLGYQRSTMPQLAKRIEQGALVYHNHYSAGNSTTPGTASLLSGTYPWTHRAFNHDTQPDNLQYQNIFNAFGADFFSQTYTHNNVAYRILQSYEKYIDLPIPRQQLFLTNDWIETVFGNDFDIAAVSVEIILKHLLNHNSLFLRDAYASLFEKNRQRIVSELAEDFPDTPPIVSGHHFLLETAIDWLLENTPNHTQPFLSYFHFLPPHAPYPHTRAEFSGKFGGIPHGVPNKPEHLFSQGQKKANTDNDRRAYDEFILYVDAEFDRLMNGMEAAGLMENTLVILTSDHGELFERGIVGHSTEAMLAPLIHVPLVIFGPDITERQDITANTSSLDVLPTLAKAAGVPVPDWCEGEFLPGFPFSTTPDPQRAIYAVNAKHNRKFGPIQLASISMTKGDHRLSAYMGYPELEGEKRYELYNLAEDPHELQDLYTPGSPVASQMIEELYQKLNEVDKPFN
jgi:arylsulfatase A-like enzyme